MDLRATEFFSRGVDGLSVKAVANAADVAGKKGDFSYRIYKAIVNRARDIVASHDERLFLDAHFPGGEDAVETEMVDGGYSITFRRRG